MIQADHQHCLRQISPYTSPPTAHHHHHHHQPFLVMISNSNLALKRVSAKFLNSGTLCLTPITNSMATAINNTHESSTTKKVEEEEEGKREEAKKKLPPPPPPPPEKPEPGDCCGSGCVRCVWDVYYEELEEYNRLYKSSDSK